MVKIVMTYAANDYSGEMGALDQPATRKIEGEEIFEYSVRSDDSGMPEERLTDRIRTFLRQQSLRVSS